MPLLSATYVERARRLLNHECASGERRVDFADAAERVYVLLDAALARLLGVQGSRSLFARAVRLTKTQFPSLGDLAGPRSMAIELRTCLEALAPDVAVEVAATLFGTLFSLMTTFVGERLTIQVVRKSWPALNEPASTEIR